jgi:hypothetical protein
MLKRLELGLANAGLAQSRHETHLIDIIQSAGDNTSVLTSWRRRGGYCLVLDLLLASSEWRSGELLGILLRESHARSLCWRLHLSEAEFMLDEG